MNKFKSFFLTALLGGITVILPAAVMWMVFHWLFKKVTQIVQPLTTFITDNIHSNEFVGDILALSIILLVCFFIGLLERTKLGSYFFKSFEKSVLIKIPGYNIVKETILQFVGDKQSPFSSVALARIFGNETKVTAFITDEHSDGSYTVFVPTGPNPTSGNIFHLKPEYVEKIKFPVEATMRSIISCGAGSKGLIQSSNESRSNP